MKTPALSLGQVAHLQVQRVKLIGIRETLYGFMRELPSTESKVWTRCSRATNALSNAIGILDGQIAMGKPKDD